MQTYRSLAAAFDPIPSVHRRQVVFCWVERRRADPSDPERRGSRVDEGVEGWPEHVQTAGIEDDVHFLAFRKATAVFG